MALQQPEIEAGEDTQHLNAIYDGIKRYKQRIAELEELYAKSQQEVAALRAELLDLRGGKGVILNIQGRHFRVTEDIQALDTSILGGSNGNGHTKNRLADSFVL